VRRIRFHDFRHTFATLMLRSGVPVKDVAYMLGHSDPATTIRVYAHAIPATHGSHARVLGSLLIGGGGTRRTERPTDVVGQRWVAYGGPAGGRWTARSCSVRWASPIWSIR
jgi:hypothetical protein